MKTWLRSGAKRMGIFLHTIRFRLTLWTVAIVSLILLAFSIFIYTRQIQNLQIVAQAQLQSQSQQLIVLYRLAGLFNPQISPFQVPDLSGGQGDLLLPDKEMLALVGPDGQTIQKAGGIGDNIISQISTAWQHASQTNPTATFTATEKLADGNGDQTNYVFLITPLLAERHFFGLMVLGRPVDPNGQLPSLLVTLLLGSIATLAIAIAGGFWLAGRAMAPVRTITRTARSIGETDLNKRLMLGTKDELGELADTFDAMLARLQAAFDRQRQFTADASHELRTPLTIVGLEADQALARHRSNEDYERAFKVIKSENEFMAHLVNDLLTLARMDAGQTQLRMEALDLSDLALEVVERLSSLAKRNAVEIDLGELPETSIQGDRQYLSQMLTNLVENAIKYAGGRGHHVHVETGSRSNGAGMKAWVQVEDDGPGIAAEYLPYLFDRFYRVDKARVRQQDENPETDQEKAPEGSGLGLSIVQWIAQAHGGKVNVQSEPGKGSCFEVEIPLN
jgi:signal transduction histidine kinase